jgi:hypothetical protein
MRNLFLFLALLIINISCFSQSRYISATTKKIVFSRDSGRCKCCRSFSNIEYDHIMPFSCGGSNEASNIQLLCEPCNRSKSNSCTCKIHDRQVGINCCDKRIVVKSSGTSSQCIGTTKKGRRCKNRTTNSNGRCYLH